ncbi:hypothetical protein [Cryptosporangium japonicum]|uniref:Uncharacterized protein n=1 Tax=Cryptosporangium japonicum TaxID=80872 RepID=A0ABN0UEL1_9ACTN
MRVFPAPDERHHEITPERLARFAGAFRVVSSVTVEREGEPTPVVVAGTGGRFSR